jgi:hypothetical protein
MSHASRAPVEPESAVEARAEALRLAFAPLMFHAVCALRDFGVLDFGWANKDRGVKRAEVAEHAGISLYAATVLLEAGLAARAFRLEGDTFFLTRVGHFLLNDEMTRVNIAFARDVCYGPLRHLSQSLKDGRPRGLAELDATLGRSESLYSDFDRLPADVSESWLAFDHYYSSLTHGNVARTLLQGRVQRLLDVGANDGRFAQACLEADPALSVTLVDHAVQIGVARERLTRAGLVDRAAFVVADLGHESALPTGFDAVWISQVLDCLSESQVVALLARLRGSVVGGGRVLVLEPCWDLQPQRVGQDVLTLLSLYFACAANGTSRMYDSGTLVRLIEAAGLTVEERHDGLGVGHSLFECVAS